MLPLLNVSATQCLRYSMSKASPSDILGLYGTFVLAAPNNTGLEVVAYLTLTDHQSGTLLVNVDAHDLGCECKGNHGKGNLEITLKSPITRGVVNSYLLDDRIIRGTIRFETGSYTAY